MDRTETAKTTETSIGRRQQRSKEISFRKQSKADVAITFSIMEPTVFWWWI
jgi:hypothetical protein